jgi:uroporphyrinogen decarboxylase
VTLTPRERVRKAIRHEQPDRVPWHFTFTAPARKKAESHYGPGDLDELLGNHLAPYRPYSFQEVRPGHWRDDFGVVWNRSIDKDIGVVDNNQLKTRSLAGYTFPDPHDPKRYEKLPAFLATTAHRFRYLSMAYSLFERAWTLRGMAELMIDMLEAPEFVDELFDAITDYNCGVLEEMLRHDIDCVRFGDDWGQQHGLIFGGPLWRRFVKPRLRRMYGMVKRAGKAVMIHSCGRVQELFPDLIELGLDIFNPFQPEVMDPYETKKQFGDKLTFYGGMSVQKLLPFGTPQQIRDEARRLMEHVGRGGGFIIASSHDMPGDIPIENMLAFIETVRNP